MNSFQEEICNCKVYKFDDDTSLQKIVQTYDTVLKSILNKHAPHINKTIYSQEESSPLFNNTLLKSKREKHVQKSDVKNQNQMNIG